MRPRVWWREVLLLFIVRTWNTPLAVCDMEKKRIVPAFLGPHFWNLFRICYRLSLTRTHKNLYVVFLILFFSQPTLSIIKHNDIVEPLLSWSNNPWGTLLSLGVKPPWMCLTLLSTAQESVWGLWFTARLCDSEMEHTVQAAAAAHGLDLHYKDWGWQMAHLHWSSLSKSALQSQTRVSGYRCSAASSTSGQ